MTYHISVFIELPFKEKLIITLRKKTADSFLENSYPFHLFIVLNFEHFKILYSNLFYILITLIITYKIL